MLRISSIINDQAVFINDQETIYRTPCIIESLSSGKYTIRLESEDFYSEPLQIVLSKDEVTSLEIEMLRYFSFIVKSRHTSLLFYYEGATVKVNEILRLKEHEHKLTPNFRGFPEIILTLNDLERGSLEYDNHLEYSRVIFENFPNKIKVIIDSDGNLRNQLSIAPSGEIKYLFSEVSERCDSNSILAIPGINKHKISWNCGNIKGKLINIEPYFNTTINFLQLLSNKTKKRKRFIAISFTIATLSLIAYLYPYQIEKTNWENALVDNSISTYSSYLARYDGKHYSRHSSEARTNIDLLQWNNAVEVGGKNQYLKYLSECSLCLKKIDARFAIDSIDFTSACSSNTTLAYQAYLDNCDSCHYSSIALKSLQELISNTHNFEIFIDSRDGNEYKSIQIGNQIWMAEDLKFKPANGPGKLYSYKTATEVCPDGWRLPRNSEWISLRSNIRNNGYKDREAIALKDTIGWYSEYYGINLTGFSATPTYYSGAKWWSETEFVPKTTARNNSEKFFNSLKSLGGTSGGHVEPTQACYFFISKSDQKFEDSHASKGEEMAVRCVKY